MEIDNLLRRNGEDITAWLKRLDGEGSLLKKVEQMIAPEIYEEPAKLPKGRKGGVDVNEMLARALDEGGVANEVIGQLVNNREPVVSGQRLATIISERKDKSRLAVVVGALMSGMGSAAKPIIREVCPVDKKERRRQPAATQEFVNLAAGTRSTVIDRVVARLTPDIKEKLVTHPIGDIVYDLQAPMRERIRRMVQEKNDPFLAGL